jgi:cell pole-organizing protein PopZ
VQSGQDDSILTDNAANAALKGFSSLAGNVGVDRGTYPGGITLEDIVRDLMKPMLREWLDQNLPPLIEKLVKQELERIANKALDK